MRFTLVLMACLQAVFLFAQQPQQLHHLASYDTGTGDAAETVAFDPGTSQVYFTSAGPMDVYSNTDHGVVVFFDLNGVFHANQG